MLAPPIDPFTFALDALLRPSQLAAFLACGRRNIRWGVLATLVWVGAATAFAGLLLPQLLRCEIATTPPCMVWLIAGLSALQVHNGRDWLPLVVLWPLGMGMLTGGWL